MSGETQERYNSWASPGVFIFFALSRSQKRVQKGKETPSFARSEFCRIFQNAKHTLANSGQAWYCMGKGGFYAKRKKETARKER